MARLCEITDGAVSQWRNNGIPKAQLRWLRLEKPAIFERLTTDQGHSGRQPPSTNNILDTVPGHSVVLIARERRAAPGEKES